MVFTEHINTHSSTGTKETGFWSCEQNGRSALAVGRISGYITVLYCPKIEASSSTPSNKHSVPSWRLTQNTVGTFAYATPWSGPMVYRIRSRSIQISGVSRKTHHMHHRGCQVGEREQLMETWLRHCRDGDITCVRSLASMVAVPYTIPYGFREGVHQKGHLPQLPADPYKERPFYMELFDKHTCRLYLGWRAKRQLSAGRAHSKIQA